MVMSARRKRRGLTTMPDHFGADPSIERTRERPATWVAAKLLISKKRHICRSAMRRPSWLPRRARRRVLPPVDRVRLSTTRPRHALSIDLGAGGRTARAIDGADRDARVRLSLADNGDAERPRSPVAAVRRAPNLTANWATTVPLTTRRACQGAPSSGL